MTPGTSLLHLRATIWQINNKPSWMTLPLQHLSNGQKTFLTCYSSHRALRGSFTFHLHCCMWRMWHHTYTSEWLRSTRTLQEKTGYFHTYYKVQRNNLINARGFGIKMEKDCANEKTLQCITGRKCCWDWESIVNVNREEHFRANED